jgi:hypothetical protein
MSPGRASGFDFFFNTNLPDAYLVNATRASHLQSRREIALRFGMDLVLVRLGHIASGMVNADHSIV